MSSGLIRWMALIILPTMAGAFHLGCGRAPIHGDSSPVLSGSVIDAASRRPVDSAWVVLGDSAWVARGDSADGVIYTDTAGSFALQHFLPISEEVLAAGKKGYVTSSKVLKGIARDTSGIVFELVRAR